MTLSKFLLLSPLVLLCSIKAEALPYETVNEARYGTAQIYPPVVISILKQDFAYSILADYLFFDAKQEQMDFMATTKKASTALNSQFHSANMDFHPAVRLGLHALSHKREDWDVRLEWLYFSPGHSKTVLPSDTNTLLLDNYPKFSQFTLQTPTISKISENWNIRSHVADLELGRIFRPYGEGVNLPHYKFLIRPFIGLRLLHITQRLTSSFTVTDASNVSEKLTGDQKTRFFGFGGRFGFDTEWKIHNEWGLYADFAFNILYGEQQTNTSEKLSSNKTTNIAHIDPFFAGKSCADIAIGLSWEKVFTEKHCALTLKLGWEEHIFWKQNAFFNVLNPLDATKTPNATLLTKNGDLFFRGLTFSVRVDL